MLEERCSEARIMSHIQLKWVKYTYFKEKKFLHLYVKRCWSMMFREHIAKTTKIDVHDIDTKERDQVFYFRLFDRKPSDTYRILDRLGYAEDTCRRWQLEHERMLKEDKDVRRDDV